jgi:hypothetical protein
VLFTQSLSAHEVPPSIGDLSLKNGEFSLDLRVNLEAFVAGIDLDGVANTNETDEAGDYDTLRALAPGALQLRAETAWPDIETGLFLMANGKQVPVSLVSIRVDEIGDLTVPRPSFISLAAILPEGTTSVTFGWDKRFGTLVLRHIDVEDGYTGYLRSGEISPKIPVEGGARLNGVQTFISYIPIGFDHILPKGLDHILFVLGLFFLSIHLRPLLWQVTAFTLAHTVTLALGALGWVSVSPAIVEPLIAASITFVAIENVMTPRLSKWRPFVIFGFGLLHGLGFASVLGEIGLPEDRFFPALIAFNVGVELGQLTVISLAFLSVGLWFGHKSWYRARISIPASLVIAAVGAYWFFERVFL